MTVRTQDIYNAGGRLPRPQGEEKASGRERDPISDIERAHTRGLANTAYARGAGLLDPKAEGSKESSAMAEALRAQTANADRLIGHILTLQGGSGKNDPVLQHLLEESKMMKERLLAPAPDPMETMLAYEEMKAKLAGFLQKDLQLPAGIQLGPPNIEATLQLKQMELDSQERREQFQTVLQESRQQHEEKMALMQRQWKREDDRWQAEFGLKARESENGSKSKDKAADALQDFATAYIDHIQTKVPSQGEGVASTPEYTNSGPGPAPQRKRKRFKCPDCEAIVTVSSPDDPEATCEQCGQVWDLREQPTEQPVGA